MHVTTYIRECEGKQVMQLSRMTFTPEETSIQALWQV